MAFEPAGLAELGWRGRRTYDSPDVASARAVLEQRNGISGLQMVSGTEPNFAATAAHLFLRDGFVVVTDVLSPASVATIRSGCARVVREMATVDLRQRYRWSFGAGRRPWGLVESEWAVLIDPPDHCWPC
jgi:hypothetical protein